MFGRYFGQLVTWLKINYFGDSNQPFRSFVPLAMFVFHPIFSRFCPSKTFSSVSLVCTDSPSQTNQMQNGFHLQISYSSHPFWDEHTCSCWAEAMSWNSILSGSESYFLDSIDSLFLGCELCLSWDIDMSFGRAFLGMLSLFKGLNNFSPPKKIII